MIKRIKSGIFGLDDLVQGGIPKNSIVLVSGEAGSGKSIFGLQFLVQGAKNNEKGIYVTFEQPEYAVVELDSYDGNMMKAVQESYTYLTANGIAQGRK